MTPKRPYLLRAFYEWILDNNMTPYITVDAKMADVSVPRQYIKDGLIVLNISPGAVRDFIADNEAVSFSARFGGVAHYIYCPIYSILAVYSRETQEGASFPPEEYESAAKPTPAKPGLVAVSSVAAPADESVDSSDSDGDKPKPRGSGKSASKSRAALRVVK